jgi:Tfp pilus assembly protein PilF
MSAISFNNFGLLRLNQGRYEEAAAYLERALVLIEQLLGPGPSQQPNHARKS